MERSHAGRAISVGNGCWILPLLAAGACAPAIGGLAAAGGGGGSTTVINATVSIDPPDEFVGSAALTIHATTTPPGQGLEGRLDSGDWQRIGGSWQLTGLADGEHTATVRVAGARNGEQSVTFTVDTVAPSAPTGLTTSGASAAGLQLSWTAGSDTGSGVASYRVDYGTTSGARTLQSSAAGTSTTIAAVDACETYYVTVTTVDRAGNTSSATTEATCRANCGGDGTFAESEVQVTGNGDEIATGDFDGDGILDLAVTTSTGLQILLGNGSDGRGDGTFATGEVHTLGGYSQAIVCADFDADRVLDLAVVYSGTVRVFLGDGSDGRGDGTFTADSTLSTNLISPLALLAMDVDGDAITDLVVGDWSGSRLVFFTGDGSAGQGDGTFTYSHQMTTGNAPGAIATGDFNADGIADLAVACQQATDVLVTHLGNGTDGAPDGTFAAKQAWLTGGFVGGDVAVVDYNSDGIADLAVTLALADIVVFMAGSGSDGRGNGTFFLEEVVGVAASPWGLLVGDFTGDHITDYATVSFNDAGVTLLRAGGEHGRADTSFTTTTVGGYDLRLLNGAVGDIDGNGSLDMLAPAIDGGVVVLANAGRAGVGDGSFAARDDDTTLFTTAFGVGAADFDSDQAPDVMLANFATPWTGGSDAVWQFLNVESEGLGTGALPTAQLLFVGSAPVAFAFGDFQRDGVTDIAIVCSDLDDHGGGDRVDVLITDADNGVGAGDFMSTSSTSVGDQPRAIVAADFDEDAILDLAVANFDGDTVSILGGDGSGGQGAGTFTVDATIPVGSGPFALVTGDFDADGITDLAVGHVTSGGGGELRILLGSGSNGRGDGTFSAGDTYVTTHPITGLAAGDFDGDGITDLVVTQWRSGGGNSASGVIVFAGDGSGGRGDGTFTAGSEVAIGGNPYALAVGDFDGDRILDLVVTDADSAVLKVLSGDGSDGRGDGTFAAPASVAIGAAAVSVLAVDLDGDHVLDLVAAGGDTMSVRFGGGDY
ncbi:MAG: VCBS repeat-containing protein [Planctomycetes bacterium]|nr:VCBS repeat-containing protein [Planctomycetota bacterium]